jgi:serine/threonine protein kinase
MRTQQVVATQQQSHVLNEKRILASMDHPFVLRLVATYQDEGELYMLLELGLGGELFSLLAKKAPLPDAQARFYSSQVVSIFTYMHGMKVVYRDLKPENLLLDEKGFLKMVDFGFAKVVQDRTWTLCGTPEYLAPEIILNKGHAFGADWWCVGILTYECLTGTTPFVSNDPMEGYRKIIKCRVPWPSNFSSLAKDFMDKLIVVDPARRLGCTKTGPAGVKEHQWFNGLSWKDLEAKAVPAPHVPKIKSQLDDSNFDEYEDEGIQNYPDSDFPKDMFMEFAETWVGK